MLLGSSNKASPMPLSIAEADTFAGRGERQYYASKSIALAPRGDVFILLHPIGEAREIHQFDRANQRWLPPIPSPGNASEILVDARGNLWAFASGLRIFQRPSQSTRWKAVGEIRDGLCYAKPQYVEAEDKFFVHAKSCDEQYVFIFSFAGT
jgi:hypothetical protein